MVIYCHIEDKKVKIFVIVLSNAVSYPWAMMIHSFNALFTQFTVMSSWEFSIITFLAITVLNQTFYFSPFVRKYLLFYIVCDLLIFSEFLELFFLWGPSFHSVNRLWIMKLLKVKNKKYEILFWIPRRGHNRFEVTECSNY